MSRDDVRPVLLVHGLWFRSPWLAPLAKRLGDAGFNASTFTYRSTRDSFEDSASRLLEHCRRAGAGGLHLVGHSLGGLLILRMLRDGGWDAPGRALLLGTPLGGSAVARRTAGWPGAGLLLGAAAGPLRDAHADWPAGRCIGMIAGSRPVGLGMITGGLQRPNDGTVAVAETRHPRLADHVTLPVTHTGMIFSARVAGEAAHFLTHGRFDAAARPGDVSP